MRYLIIILMTCGLIHQAHAEEPSQGLQFEGFTMPAPLAGTPMAAIYGTFINPTDTTITISAANVSIAEHTELHTTTENEGMMQMRKVDNYAIPAEGSFMLERGGNHIMLIGLKDEPITGDDVTITFTLADGTTLEHKAAVVDAKKAVSGHQHHHH